MIDQEWLDQEGERLYRELENIPVNPVDRKSLRLIEGAPYTNGQITWMKALLNRGGVPFL